jgi:hypothetical protein
MVSDLQLFRAEAGLESSGGKDACSEPEKLTGEVI